MGSHPINVDNLKGEQQPKEHHQLAKETLGYKSACEQTRPQGKAKQGVNDGRLDRAQRPR